MNDEIVEIEPTTAPEDENPVSWLVTVALKIGLARLTAFILDALDL